MATDRVAPPHARLHSNESGNKNELPLMPLKTATDNNFGFDVVLRELSSIGEISGGSSFDTRRSVGLAVRMALERKLLLQTRAP